MCVYIYTHTADVANLLITQQNGVLANSMSIDDVRLMAELFEGN